MEASIGFTISAICIIILFVVITIALTAFFIWMIAVATSVFLAERQTRQMRSEKNLKRAGVSNE